MVLYLFVVGPLETALSVWKILAPGNTQIGIHVAYTLVVAFSLLVTVHAGLLERLHALDTATQSRMTGDAKEAIAARLDGRGPPLHYRPE